MKPIHFNKAFLENFRDQFRNVDQYVTHEGTQSFYVENGSDVFDIVL